MTGPVGPYHHPVHVVELEGVHIVKNDKTGKFTYLSDNMGSHDIVELTEHDDIIEHLAQLSTTPEDLEFSFVGNNLSTAFLDA